MINSFLYLCATLGFLVEFIDFFYILHTSLRDDALWLQFGLGYILCFVINVAVLGSTLTKSINYTKIVAGSSILATVIFVSVFLADNHSFFPLLLSFAGFVRIEPICKLALLDDHRTAKVRSVHLKLLQTIALVGAMTIIFIMWSYPSIALYIVVGCHSIQGLLGLALAIFIKLRPEQATLGVVTGSEDGGDLLDRRGINSTTQQQRLSPAFLREIFSLEEFVTMCFYALQVYLAVVLVTRNNAVFLPIVNVVFALVSAIFLILGYQFVRPHNVTSFFFRIFLIGMALAVVASGFVFVFRGTDVVHSIVHMVVMALLACVHPAPWIILIDCSPEKHVRQMVRFHAIGQGIGIVMGLFVYQMAQIAVYLPLFALGVWYVRDYESAYLLEQTNK